MTGCAGGVDRLARDGMPIALPSPAVSWKDAWNEMEIRSALQEQRRFMNWVGSARRRQCRIMVWQWQKSKNRLKMATNKNIFNLLELNRVEPDDGDVQCLTLGDLHSPS